VQLHRDRASFAEAGACLVLIGQATAPHAAHFRRTQGIDLPVLADGERLTYKAAGAKVATMDELLGPLVVANGVIAIAKHGVFQGRTIGDFAQLGGAMIIDIDGAIIWSHMSEDASDIASAVHILAALESNRLSAPARPGPAVDGV
jgi:peroxiredoxin